MSANALQLARLLDITLRNGDSAILAGIIKGDGIQTGEADRFKNFDELKTAFLRQADYFIDKIVQGSNMRDRLYAETLQAPYISAFMDGCLDKRKDVTHGGARYDLAGISMVNAIANTVDSLYALKKLVFDSGRYRIAEFIEAMDANFEGHERLLADIQALPGKWGNADPEVDELAHEIMQALADCVLKHRSFKDAPFVVYVISMITHTIDGRLSPASADGRRAATPYAASCNPYNVDRSGATAMLRSVAALPFEDILGAAVNVKFHPSAIGETRAARNKWIALIRTYFRLGGAQLQPTCVSAQTLREAQQRPDAHRDLIVKVGGYSTYFVDLGIEIQDEIISRTEHAAG